ncbi:hypothetical protein CRUP_019805, partial [Coryphaenoides rupestris]
VNLEKSTLNPSQSLTFIDTSSASEDEGSLRRQGRLTTASALHPGLAHPTVEHWFNRVIQGSSSTTSSSASSTSSHPGGRGAATTTTTTTTTTASSAAAAAAAAVSVSATAGNTSVTPNNSATVLNANALAELMAHTLLDNHSAPPDVTGLSERPQVGSMRAAAPRGHNPHHASVMETADGVPVNSRVSSKIQQLLNTLKEIQATAAQGVLCGRL